MGLKKLNNKGYMLVEIVLASVLAFGIAYFILDMTIKLKNKNDDLLVETLTATDQAIITNMLMSSIKEEPDKFDCGNISIENNTFKYKDSTNIINKYAEVAVEECKNNENSIIIKIKISVTQLPDKNFNVIVCYKKQSIPQ